MDLDALEEPDGEASIRVVSVEEYGMTYSEDDKEGAFCDGREADGDAYIETFMDLDGK